MRRQRGIEAALVDSWPVVFGQVTPRCVTGLARDAQIGPPVTFIL